MEHREALGLCRTELLLLSQLMMFVVSLKNKPPIRGQMAKISKIIYIFSRISNSNIMTSTASLFTLSSLMLPPPTFPLTHSFPATLAPLLFPEFTRAFVLAISHAWKALPLHSYVAHFLISRSLLKYHLPRETIPSSLI